MSELDAKETELENSGEEEQVTEPKEVKPAKTTKAKKSVVAEVQQAVVNEVEVLFKDTKAVAEAEVKRFASELEGKSVQELAQLRENALYDESELKRQLHLLRLRAANLATTAETDVDHEIIKIKQELSVAADWLHAVEDKLKGEVKDFSGILY